MIALLKGSVRLLSGEVIIETAGVGYGVKVSQKVISALADKSQAELYIHTHVREDRFELYGFLTPQEKDLFELVQSVSGVGPSTALNLMDKHPDQLISAVQEADVSFFKTVPRVGKKLAQKIIIELRGKLGELKELNLAPLSSQLQDVADALISLGWSEEQARQAIENLNLDNLTPSAAIKEALKYLGDKQRV